MSAGNLRTCFQCRKAGHKIRGFPHLPQEKVKPVEQQPKANARVFSLMDIGRGKKFLLWVYPYYVCFHLLDVSFEAETFCKKGTGPPQVLPKKEHGSNWENVLLGQGGANH